MIIKKFVEKIDGILLYHSGRAKEKIRNDLALGESLHCFFEESGNFPKNLLVGMIVTKNPSEISLILESAADEFKKKGSKVFNDAGLFQFRVLRRDAENELKELLTKLNSCDFIFSFELVPNNSDGMAKKEHIIMRLNSFVSEFNEISRKSTHNQSHLLYFDNAFLGGMARKTYFFAIEENGGAWIPGVTKFKEKIEKSLLNGNARIFDTKTINQDWTTEGVCLQAADLLTGAVRCYIKDGDKQFYDLIKDKLYTDG